MCNFEYALIWIFELIDAWGVHRRVKRCIHSQPCSPSSRGPVFRFSTDLPINAFEFVERAHLVADQPESKRNKSLH